MDTVEVVLQPYGNRSFVLSKDWIRTALPSSILASSLEDPDAASILIPNKNVSPDILQLMVDLSQGHEPLQHNPNLILAHHYLNIPELLYYADPLYDQIPNRSNGAAPENINFIQELLKENRVWPFGYLILKGYIPTNKDLMTAINNRAVDVIRLLLKDSRVNPAADDNFSIREAAKNGHAEVVRLLLADPRVDPTAARNSALMWAAENGHVEVVKLLLADPRVDPTDINNFAIRWAARNGHTEVVKLLLADKRVNPADDDNSAILWAAEQGRTEVVRLLLADSRVYPANEDDDTTAIREAARNGHVEVVRLLLADYRVDPTDDDNSAILWAAENGHFEVVRLLLEDPRVRQSLTPGLLAEYQQMVLANK